MSFDEFCEKLLGKKKEFRMPTEEEYYAYYERMDPERPGPFSESDRIAMRKIKKNPVPYELMKKALTGE